MSFGYIWSAPSDFEIRDNGDKTYDFKWRTEEKILETQHIKEQHPGMKFGSNTEDFVMKWSFNFIIQTPDGYSTMFTHPLNRYDLPFRTLSGVVDTDSYPIPVLFPFIMISGAIKERVIIEKGTPLCQFFVIKRDPWHSAKKNISENDYRKNASRLTSKIVRSYKSQFWKKKIFD